MAKIIWIASYPKSGNTWMRILLTNYLRNRQTPAEINRLEGGPIASSRAFFDEWVGVEASMLDDAVIERLRPEVFRCLLREVPEDGTLFMKVHDAWGTTDRGESIFPRDATGGVVYLLRNPLDLAVSCANHWGVDLKLAVDHLCDPEFAMARSRDSLSDQLHQRLYSWNGHVRSWIDRSGLPIHAVRYEDLLHDPTGTFEKVVHFCGLPVDLERVARAVTFSHFSELQRQEKSDGFRERPVKALTPFFRCGQAGAWREELPGDLVQQLIETQGPCMRRFGYLDLNNHPN
jgi:aryl sulfotransferase